MKVRLLMLGLVAALLVISAQEPITKEPAQARHLQTLTNQERVDQGIKALKPMDALTDMAFEKASRMAKDGTVYHDNAWLKREAPPGWCALGENVGMASTVEAIHGAFMSSPGHKKNILDKQYTHIGVGVYSDGDYMYASVIFACYPPPKPPAPKPKAKPSPPKESCK